VYAHVHEKGSYPGQKVSHLHLIKLNVACRMSNMAKKDGVSDLKLSHVTTFLSLSTEKHANVQGWDAGLVKIMPYVHSKNLVFGSGMSNMTLFDANVILLDAHLTLLDLAHMEILPNMTIFVPKNL
jgi:hypothetical protein